MTGKRKSVKIPVLVDGDYLAITNKEKSDLLGTKFASIHSGSHLDEVHKRRKEDIIRKCSDVRKKDTFSQFSTHELNMALEKSGYTAPGQDQLCYAMFRQLPDEYMEIIRRLFNKIWREGKLPHKWKSALILPFSKPGKAPDNAGNYRHVALTSHLCKWMEKVIVRRLSYYSEWIDLCTKWFS